MKFSFYLHTYIQKKGKYNVAENKKNVDKKTYRTCVPMLSLNINDANKKIIIYIYNLILNA